MAYKSVYIQPDGPGTPPRLMGCVEVDSVTTPKGAVERSRWYDSNQRRWSVVTRRQQAADAPTLTISELTTKVQSYMEHVLLRGCPVGVYINDSQCPTHGLFDVYDRSIVLEDTMITATAQANVRSRDTVEDTESSYDLDAAQTATVFPLNIEERALFTSPLRDVAINTSRTCGYDQLIAVEAAPAGRFAWVLWVYDDDIGDGLPFDLDEDIASVVVTDDRVIVARGTADLGNPAEIAYSDDDGVIFHNVDVGSTNGEYALWSGALSAVGSDVWLVTNLGNVYHSEDRGAAWALQAAVSDELRYIHMMNSLCGVAVGGTTGASNVAAYTQNGGRSWEEVPIVGPAPTAMANCVAMVNRNQWLVGFENGTLWRVQNQVWQQVTTVPVPPGATMAAIENIKLLTPYIMSLSFQYELPGPAHYGGVQRSRDGGYHWDMWSSSELVDDAFGFPGLAMSAPNIIVAGGNLLA